MTDGGERSPTLANRLSDRWDRRRAADASADVGRAALATAKDRERLRRRWAKARNDLATTRREDLRFTVMSHIPVPADVVWRALVDPAGPHAGVHAPPFACATLPGPAPDAVGSRTCALTREPSGDVSVTLDQVVHVEQGRRLTRQSLQSPYRTLTGWWLEPAGAGTTVLRGFTQLSVPRRCAWPAAQIAEADLRRRAWMLCAGLAGPEAAGPQPPLAPLAVEGVRARADAADRLARGPRVVVSEGATIELAGVPVHAAWVAVCAVPGPTVEHGDPDAHWFPLRDGPAGRSAALRGTVVRHPLGHVDAFVDEVVAWTPGVRIVTRLPTPFEVLGCVDLTPGPNGTTVEVRLRAEVLPDATRRAQRVLAVQAHTNARRIERQALGRRVPPLDEVWFP